MVIESSAVDSLYAFEHHGQSLIIDLPVTRSDPPTSTVEAISRSTVAERSLVNTSVIYLVI